MKDRAGVELLDEEEYAIPGCQRRKMSVRYSSISARVCCAERWQQSLVKRDYVLVAHVKKVN